jgi:hypothetical protein
MEKIYSERPSACEFRQVSKEKIDFLLAFSKSLRVLSYKGYAFEANLN